jgi:hypothetical protein
MLSEAEMGKNRYWVDGQDEYNNVWIKEGLLKDEQRAICRTFPFSPCLVQVVR